MDWTLRIAALALLLVLLAPLATAHGVAEGDQDALRDGGPGVYLYQGAKHMVTGYDHLLFLAGVIFFLFRTKDVFVFVSWFTLGHSVTLLLGVIANIQANAFLVDAVIGLSVVYKGFDNIGGFKQMFGRQPNAKMAVLGFGLIHGFGLATKVQDLVPRGDQLISNIIFFNIGVELGQIIVLSLILAGLVWWRRHPGYMQHSYLANSALMAAGFTLFGLQMTGFFTQP